MFGVFKVKFYMILVTYHHNVVLLYFLKPDFLTSQPLLASSFYSMIKDYFDSIWLCALIHVIIALFHSTRRQGQNNMQICKS